MFLKKSILTLALTALLAFSVLDACAQWSPGGTVVYMGDLNLAGNVGQSERGAYVIGSMASQGSSGSPASSGGLGSSSSQLANDVTVNNPSMNNSSMNNSSLDNSSINNASMNAVPTNAMPLNIASMDAASTAEPQTVAVLDLSSYAKDRVKGDLTGYTNIMYPFAESKGSTTSTAGGGGGGGGCGCG